MQRDIKVGVSSEVSIILVIQHVEFFVVFSFLVVQTEEVEVVVVVIVGVVEMGGDEIEFGI